MDCIAVTGGSSGDSSGTILDDAGADEGLENDFPAVFASAEVVVGTAVISGTALDLSIKLGRAGRVEVRTSGTVLDLGVKLGRAGKVEVRICDEGGPCVFGFAAEAGLVDQVGDSRPSGPKPGEGATMGDGIK